MAGNEAVADRKSSALQELTSLPRRGENPYIRAWKEGGGKVFGYVCCYVPEEVLHANPADILPIRMGAAGCGVTGDADVCMHKFTCGFSRGLLELGLTGEYGFLDGIVMSNGCDQIRRTYEYWRDEVKPPFITMVAVPHSTEGDKRAEWYLDEVRKLIDDVGVRFGFLPSEESLRKSIKTYNRYRELMLELYRLRSTTDPKLTGSEAMKIAQAGFAMPKDVFNRKLEEAIEEIGERPGIKDCRARIMLAGSYLDDTFLIDLIESTGAVVVADNLCTGRRYVEGMVDENAEPVAAIAERYFRKMACPRMVGSFRKRVEFTKKLAEDAKVDGVIFQRLPFCDNHSVENLMESPVLQQAGIPTIDLEREYIAADEGRLKTRVQAFLEKIGK
jgi:benzoyl-CoA reductase/2-hydroxyglutaryl-CoA dehydratase subunit BcrC/BadD/HgdB